MNEAILIPVIMSGGSGTRLWPVSRRAYPKPFMQMADGETLAEKTLRRALAASSNGELLTVTNRDHYFITRDAYAAAGADLSQAHFLLEPVARNTAPAVAAAAHFIHDRYGDQAQMLVMPADHLIQNLDHFLNNIKTASLLAAQGFLVSLGVFPTHPETGYGYIQTGTEITNGGFETARFVEKPDRETAQQYLQSGGYLWNAGIFCFPVKGLLQALDQYAPEVAQPLQHCWASSQRDTSPLELDQPSFAQVPDISIDYALMERAEKRAVVPGDFGWSDVGSWKAMSSLGASDQAGNRIIGKAITVDSKNCYIQSAGRLVATVGVNDLVVVDTGDAVLVSDRDRSQDVKAVVEQLRRDDHEAATYHQTVYRPWGSYTILEDANDCKVKRLVVKPGQVLSLQRHQRRSEHWTVVQGTAKVRVADDEFLLEQNQSVYIPLNTLHRLENPTEADIALIEVQCGDYFGEDDIERFEDVYGRA